LTEAAAASGAGAQGAAEPARGGDPLARTVFCVLVLACLLAFFLTQRLKHTPTVVQEFKLDPYFSPTPGGKHKQEAISFKVEHAERITVQVLDTASGDVVATLVRNLAAPRYKIVSLRWDGRRGVAHRIRIGHTASGRAVLIPRNTGSLAPAGEYRVKVAREHGRSVLSTRSFTLVRR
jgi:hypothetical protein